MLDSEAAERRVQVQRRTDKSNIMKALTEGLQPSDM